MDRTLLERSCRLGTSTWSDALDHFGLEGVLGGLTQRSGRGRFAGIAVTARQIAGPLGTYAKSEFAVGTLLESLSADRVLAIDAGAAEISCFGGLAALAATMQGAAAVIIDGGCRDVDEIRATKLWLATRFVTPRTGKTRIKLEAVGQPIVIAGVTVRPNDVVVGDETGIIVVPSEMHSQVLAKAEALLAQDHELERLVKDGQSFSAAAAAVGYL